MSILPSDPPGPAPGWSRWHQRLHRHLLHQPQLLPAGERLLLAVSGGQDSMALAGLLADLRRLHHWQLWLWHGNHGWRPEADGQAAELARWAEARGLPLACERAEPAPAGEAAGRHWRYQRLAALAGRHGCHVVVTGHTASDRAETVLLQMARGSHRRGLASLRDRRPLQADGAERWLARPLLIFQRSETRAICRELGLPVWVDASNDDPRFGRNRVRREVLPVLEQLHPGAARRISAMAGRLAAEDDAHRDLLDLALEPLLLADGGLGRPALMAQAAACRRALLRHWLEQHQAPPAAAALERLLTRLNQAGPGRCSLPGGRSLHWNRHSLWITAAAPASGQAGNSEMDGG